jgi:hypothetical protein
MDAASGRATPLIKISAPAQQSTTNDASGDTNGAPKTTSELTTGVTVTGAEITTMVLHVLENKPRQWR